MKKKVFLSLCLTGCMMATAPAVVYAEAEETTNETEETAEAPAEEETEEAAEEAAPAEDTEAGLSDDIYSFSVQIGGEIYQFPMLYADFVEKGGWEVSSYYADQEEDMLTPNSYTFMGFEKDGNKVSIDVINYDINEVPMKECYAGGLNIDGSYDFDEKAIEVVLPGGIKMGEATMEDIEAAYGAPSDTYEGDLYTKVSYERDSYEEISLYVYKESGTLGQIDIRNFAEPEGFQVGEVSTEVPEIVTSYEVPKALTDDYTDPIVEYMGDLYRLPAPVSAFLANGWSIKDVSESDYVRGGGIAFVDMLKDNQSMHMAIYNDTNNATSYENCMVHELEFHTYDNEIIAMKLSGGVTLGANADELMAAAKENEYYVNDRIESGYLTVAKSEDVKYDNYVEFWIDTSEDEVAIAGITCRVEEIVE